MMSGFARNVLWYAAHKRIKMSHVTCKAICSGAISVDGGPVRAGDGLVTVLSATSEVSYDEAELQKRPALATEAVLGKYMEEIKAANLSSQDTRVLKQAFKKASYSKSLATPGGESRYRTTVKELTPYVVEVDESLLTNKNDGILAKHPTFSTLKALLNQREMSLLAKVTIQESRPSGVSFYEWFYGLEGTAPKGALGQDFDDVTVAGKASIVYRTRKSVRLKFDFQVFT
jgi:hypothetical protein